MLAAVTSGIRAKKVEFSLTILDAYSKLPFSNLTIKLKLPNKSTKEFKTNALGKVVLKDPNVTVGLVDILEIHDKTETPYINYNKFISKGLKTNTPHKIEIPNKRKAINNISQKLSVVRRMSWGNVMPKYQIMAPDWDYNTIVIHHSGNGGAKIPTEIERKHMSEKKWDDVGYHFMIQPNGKIYEGRYLTFKGSHVRAANTGKIGILVMGDFQHQWWDFDDDPSKSQFKSLESLVLAIKASLPTVTKIGGHRDYMTTDCPGDELYKVIPGIRTKTGLAGP
jgi:hypothetical protein